MSVRKRFNQLEVLFDLTIIVAFLVLFLRFHYLLNIKYIVPSYLEIIQSHYKAIILICSVWVLLVNNFNYLSINNFKLYRQIGLLIKIFVPFSLFFFTISSLKSEDLLSVSLSISYLLGIFVLMLLGKLTFFYILKYFFEKGLYTSNAIIIGNNNNVERFLKVINRRKDLGINVLGFMDDQTLKEIDINEYFVKNKISIIYIAHNGLNFNPLYKDVYDSAQENHIEINYIPYTFEEKVLSFSVKYIDTLPIYSIKKYPLDYLHNQILKSIFDFTISLIICVFIIVFLFPIIALLIRLDSKGPILFKQKRRGLSGKEFDCYKFRTMRNDGTNSIQATVVNDSRVTKIGYFLRKTSLDEFPQFFNVLKGDMSIVGPRPHMISQDIHYSKIIKKYNLRNYVKPGITGLAQVKGYRGAIDCDKDMEDRIMTDIFYVKNWSLLLDIQIIYQTIVLIFKGDENAI